MATNGWWFVVEVADGGLFGLGFVGIIIVPSTAVRWDEDRIGGLGGWRGDAPAMVGIGGDGCCRMLLGPRRIDPFPGRGW